MKSEIWILNRSGAIGMNLSVIQGRLGGKLEL